MAPASTEPESPTPPSPFAILGAYLLFGTIVSFVFGREPGTLPDNIIKEVSPALIAICGFLARYALWDVIAVGLAKQDAGLLGKRHQDLPAMWPEEVFLAQRVQTNQIEQLPAYIVGALGCAIVVNGTVAGILALIWAILRHLYAETYRAGVGKSMDEIGLSRFTLPSYFAANIPLMATMVHAIRCLLSSE
mmetsp:Transcript_38992/g.94279  ORF Transcript_38992/g.94279 Transcript_38992/m.94279 type:complete len:191 (-) Transcript_38992:2104-2676(-)|eukprot:CAMPEP_0113602828 /NCGR_PEP_ID=MMETSP0017_2-20120614/959_1 /TAXON_ID=2856 /ORGANISM="Cylindrotheca closterium" /LENGTH=190 /DNA_ID=CAMNT_0000511191 /DNA_START=74 /DNA_END=646 /DNA_ORIENTATION=- /assembly_acc=CAM_ASM_000147